MHVRHKQNSNKITERKKIIEVSKYTGFKLSLLTFCSVTIYFFVCLFYIFSYITPFYFQFDTGQSPYITHISFPADCFVVTHKPLVLQYSTVQSTFMVTKFLSLHHWHFLRSHLTVKLKLLTSLTLYYKVIYYSDAGPFWFRFCHAWSQDLTTLCMYLHNKQKIFLKRFSDF